jgi:hypothetical protein
MGTHSRKQKTWKSWLKMVETGGIWRFSNQKGLSDSLDGRFKRDYIHFTGG